MGDQLGNDAGAHGTEEHAAAKVAGEHVDTWPAGYRANEGEAVG